MSVPLLRTKLYIPPPQPGLVHRPRLTRQINEGLARKLTLVCAPAGFGKTTLLSEWIPTSRRSVAWLSLEDADNDPARFWTYFLAALQMLHESLVKNALAFLHAAGQPIKLPQLESFLTILLNDITVFQDEFGLILDDYQHINNKAITEGLIFLIDHLPPNMHLIITSRADPPLPLSRLRARGQMTELRADDLRFTSEEILTFLNQFMKLNLSIGHIAALEARTEGWIVGLQLAAISMQKRKDSTDFIESFTGSHRFILDYLVDEVLGCQPEEVQSFLLETSILERLTGSLCNSITGKHDGQRMLEQLEQDNLFIVPLDNERHWYRYHRLFADLLRSRLQESQPDQVHVLHLRACEWFERQGLLPEAVNHALTVADFERAAQLIERTAETQRQRGEIATLAGWMNSLPGSIRRSHPALNLAYARALVDASQNTSIETLIEEAEAGLDTDLLSDERRLASLRGQIAALRTYLTMIRYQFKETIEFSLLAQELLGEGDARWRSFVALHLAGAYRFTNAWAAAGQTYLEASDLSRAAGDYGNALTALSLRGEVLQAQGNLRQSAQQYEQVLELAQELAIPTAPATGYALVGLGRAWCEWNDLEAATRYVQKGLETSKKAGIMDILLRGYLVLARVSQAQGDLEGALVELDNAELAARQIDLATVKDWVNALRAQVWLARGETEAAVGWASSLSGDIQDSIFPSIAIVLAKVRLVQDQPEEALAILEHALQSAYAVGRLGNAVQILAIMALAHRAQHNLAQANSALLKALTLAEPEGYMRVFLDEGEPLRLLISDIKLAIREVAPGSQKTLSDYIDKLLSAFTISPLLRNRHLAIDNLQSGIAEPLTERELEVLRLMASGLSNRDIADIDVVSINTVKTQVKSIFGKLGTHNRTDTITAARELGLL